ncbi:MAG: ABC transporter substrate-binding protein [Rhizobiaceae bacterium]|nr:ABC transporter substrate-binding protein [Rhizobiaceae bacterium]
MKTNRRTFLGGVALAGVAMSSGKLSLGGTAHAQGVKRVTFASAGPITGNWDTTSHTTVGQWNAEHFIFSHLTKAPMKPEKPDELLPDLAVSWTIVDPHTIEFKLREGVKFHNGQDFTAEDVKATFDYASDPSRPSASLYPGKADITVVDKYTLRINTEKYGYPAAAYYYLVSFLPIMSAADIANPSVLQAKPNGTGPFKFAATEGDKTTLAAYDDYYDGRPQIDEVVYAYVPSPNTRVLGLLNGEYQIIERLEPEQYSTLESNPDVKVDRALSLENKYLHFRCNKPPFDDIRVRMAACHAIDRSQIMEVVGIAGQESSSYISPLKFGYADIPNYPTYDPAKCQELLAEAGFPNGQGLPELEYITSVGFYPKTREYGELITAMMQEQGFPVKLTVLEPAAWEDQIYRRADGQGAGHMVDVGWMTGSPEPDLVLFPNWFSKSSLFPGLVDTEIDAVLEKERNAATPEERAKIIREETLPTIASKVPSLSLFSAVHFHAMAKGLDNVVFAPNGPIDLSKATLS